MITVRQMRYFDALATTLHFGRAAELAHVSQPALSAQIIEMEDNLGVKLVERSRGNTLLTRKGEAVLKQGLAKFERGEPCGEEANMGKMLCADAAWAAAEACLQTHGGFGFAEEYDIERKYRETRLYQVAPISTNLILSYIGQHVLGMPRSY